MAHVGFCGILTLGLFHTLIFNKPEPSFHQFIHLREQLVSPAGPLSHIRITVAVQFDQYSKVEYKRASMILRQTIIVTQQSHGQTSSSSPYLNTLLSSIQPQFNPSVLLHTRTDHSRFTAIVILSSTGRITTPASSQLPKPSIVT
ncbi:hypothetical protein BU25DRAFT_239622 [Macroventuria anomochaeta]|uniref:Uncharacterized protein n=1 Tax=Macroventuria anomochaeta TaxID=301207 RepID=A0ACB6RHB7_9PLEO|nr:uncharacterized protein BU25DRAFT_239622 [Macroventuria anomochaeta]KAF2621271.1 hypothetical protein BU25DRAFT_239622 [Macroventuria anomochaeta]